MNDERQPEVYSWGTAVGFALALTAAAVGVIWVFTHLVDWVGGFWSQVVYFLAAFALVIGMARRSRQRDDEDRSRLGRAATRFTPAGLPGPFVMTQAFGILGIVMIVVGALIGDLRGLMWIFSGIVLLLVGVVGLIFWLAGLRAVNRD